MEANARLVALVESLHSAQWYGEKGDNIAGIAHLDHAAGWQCVEQGKKDRLFIVGIVQPIGGGVPLAPRSNKAGFQPSDAVTILLPEWLQLGDMAQDLRFARIRFAVGIGAKVVGKAQNDLDTGTSQPSKAGVQLI